MIAIDTNVLLRYLLQDDEEQSSKANRLIEGKSNVLITDIVLAETIWTLKGKKYKLPREDILLVVEQLFKEPNIGFEDGQSVWRALNDFRNSDFIKVGSKKKDADFSDALILEKAKYDCSRKNQTFDGLFSFDVAAQQIDGIEKP
ncbi:MAG: type II toxin-antitoxin system VapC family toxin [Gammaproteobacteria bacterium]|nr:type II toxin-antitoxin system VapC family toxin [Gammaproteobacteria bacterium]